MKGAIWATQSGDDNTLFSRQSSSLLRVYCYQNETYFLVDSGSSYSVLPRSIFTPEKECEGELVAANGSSIAVYGTRRLQVDFSLGKVFFQSFIIADVKESIIGADFLADNKILVCMSRRSLILENDLRFFAGNMSSDKVKSRLKVPVSLRVKDLEPSSYSEEHIIYGHNISSLDPDVQKIIRKYPRILDVMVFKDPPKHEHRMKIELITDEVVFTKPRPLPMALEKPAMEIVNELISIGVMRPGTSAYNSPAFIIEKADHKIESPSYRLISDFRAINAQTVPLQFPLPYIDSLYPRLQGRTVYTRIDLKHAYYSLPLDDDSIKYTTVSLGTVGQFQFLKAAMGLSNSGRCFQKFVNVFFSGCEDFFFIYCDDGILYSYNREQHLEHLEIIFSRIFKYGLVLNLKKSEFFVTSVVFLGVHLSPSGISPLTKRVEAIKEFKRPVRQKDLRSWCGIVAYNRRFLPRAAEVMAPIFDILQTRGNKRVCWNEKAIAAFEEMKSALCESTLLVHPIMNATLQLFSDASTEAAGGHLQQVFQGNVSTIGYFSRRFTAVQKRYSTFTLELLAAKMAIVHFAFYLKGRSFSLHLDCKAIVMTMQKRSFENLSNMDFRLVTFIMENASEIVHVSGKDNFISDSLSHPVINAVQDYINTVSLSEIAQFQTPVFIEGIKNLQKSSLQIVERVLPESGLILYGDVSVESKFRPLIPDDLRFRIFSAIHGLSHFGYAKTRGLIADRYVWVGMNVDIKKFISECATCERVKVRRHNKAPLERFPAANMLWSHCTIDIVGPLPVSVSLGVSYKYLLTMCCRYSRWFEAAPMADVTTETVISTFLNNWVSSKGVPQYISSDRGAQFTSGMFRKMTEYLGVIHKTTTSYHPIAQGLIEGTHRILKYALKSYLNRARWTDFLPFVLLAMRSSVQIQVGIAPCEMVYGQSLRLPCEFFEDTGKDLSDWEISRQIHSFSTFLRERQGILPRYQPRKSYIDPKLKDTRFVYIRKAKKPNLLPIYDGPFLVIRKFPKYFRVLLSRNKEDNVSIDRLCACSNLPFSLTPINPDIIYPGAQIEEVEEELDGGEIVEEELPDVIDEFPGILEGLFRETSDKRSPEVRTRAGRLIKRPARLADYEL